MAQPCSSPSCRWAGSTLQPRVPLCLLSTHTHPCHTFYSLHYSRSVFVCAYTCPTPHYVLQPWLQERCVRPSLSLDYKYICLQLVLQLTSKVCVHFQSVFTLQAFPLSMFYTSHSFFSFKPSLSPLYLSLSVLSHLSSSPLTPLYPFSSNLFSHLPSLCLSTFCLSLPCLCLSLP